MRTRIKICGITRAEDAVAAAELGADAVGIVFCPESRRAVDRPTALEILADLPPFVSAVGLFVDPEANFVRTVLRELRIDILQFHGNESPEFCGQFGRRYLKAVPMGEGGEAAEYTARYPDASGFVFDGHRAGEMGGQGVGFDHSRLPSPTDRATVLAGGLTPENVRSVVEQWTPFAVDVSSGVESATGVKDPQRIARFISEVESVRSSRAA